MLLKTIEFAEQRGFFTAKAARPDVYRGNKEKKKSYIFPSIAYQFICHYIAANTILRLTTDGRILLSFKPPGFFHSTKYEKLRVIEADKASPDDTEDVGAERPRSVENRSLAGTRVWTHGSR